VNEQLKRLSRRHFLSGAAIAAGTAILAACGGSNSATDTPKPAATTGGAATTAPVAAATSAVPAATTAAGSAAVKPAGTTAAGSAAAGSPAANPATMGKVRSQIDTAGIKKGGSLIEGGHPISAPSTRYSSMTPHPASSMLTRIPCNRCRISRRSGRFHQIVRPILLR